MAVSVSAQALVFLYSCAVGAALGALYDIFRIMRLAVPCSKAAVFFQDVMFLLACALITFFFMLLESSGNVRLFIVEGEILGAVLYYMTLGVLVMKLSGVTLVAMKRFKSSIARLLSPPVKKTYTKINSFLDAKGRKAKKMLIKENKVFEIRLKLAQKMLYNLIHIQKAHNEAEKSK